MVVLIGLLVGLLVAAGLIVLWFSIWWGIMAVAEKLPGPLKALGWILGFAWLWGSIGLVGRAARGVLGY